MRIPAGALLLLVLACACDRRDDVALVGELSLPPTDAVAFSVQPGAAVDDLAPVIESGLATPRKGPDHTRFVVIRAGDRHGADYRAKEFHVVVGAGVGLPDGGMRVMRHWNASGMVDGVNEHPQNYGVAIVVEPGAAHPFSAAVTQAVRVFCEALARRVPIHPDCVIAMQELPYTNEHEADPHERALAAAARSVVPIPAADLHLEIVSGDRRIPISCEHRKTTVERAVGMMMRRGFDGSGRGMLFEYEHRTYRSFWMFNCLIPIDLAYLREGKIEQLITMKATPRVPRGELRRYASNAAVRWALEMPAGWFEANGVKVGDSVDFK